MKEFYLKSLFIITKQYVSKSQHWIFLMTPEEEHLRQTLMFFYCLNLNGVGTKCLCDQERKRKFSLNKPKHAT